MAFENKNPKIKCMKYNRVSFIANYCVIYCTKYNHPRQRSQLDNGSG